MVDIVPELLEKIEKDFEAAVASDTKIQKFLRKVRNGTADMNETSLFARGLGDKLAEVLKKDITQSVLPDGRMYYNISDRIIRTMLEKNFALTNEAAIEVQKVVDEAAGFHLSPMQGELPTDRINSIVGAVSEEGIEWDEVQRRMDEPVRNISQSFMDDFVKANANFRYRSGIETKITRKLQGKACAWCKNLAGSYSYPDVPQDVYRRHDNCRCTVTFHSGRKRQDVWNKNTWSEPDQMEQRKTIGLELTKRTRQQAKEKEAELMAE